MARVKDNLQKKIPITDFLGSHLTRLFKDFLVFDLDMLIERSF